MGRIKGRYCGFCGCNINGTRSGAKYCSQTCRDAHVELKRQEKKAAKKIRKQ